MFYSTQTTKHLTRSGTTTVYENHFTMTFEDEGVGSFVYEVQSSITKESAQQ